MSVGSLQERAASVDRATASVPAKTVSLPADTVAVFDGGVWNGPPIGMWGAALRATLPTLHGQTLIGR